MGRIIAYLRGDDRIQSFGTGKSQRSRNEIHLKIDYYQTTFHPITSVLLYHNPLQKKKPS
ncbi:MAG: hypothetical protein MZU97_04875 [Bacillus subtilis]|nr:hypothetical protein [Bacillus subtilis]